MFCGFLMQSMQYWVELLDVAVQVVIPADHAGCANTIMEGALFFVKGGHPESDRGREHAYSHREVTAERPVASDGGTVSLHNPEVEPEFPDGSTSSVKQSKPRIDMPRPV